MINVKYALLSFVLPVGPDRPSYESPGGSGVEALLQERLVQVRDQVIDILYAN